MRVLAVIVVLAVAIAGCSGGKDGKGTSDGSGDGPGGVPMLHGYVFDPTIRPLEGATVTVLDTNASVVSDDIGYFGLDGLPTEQFLVLVATKSGYIPQSKQVTLVPDTPVRLNFTLEPEPVVAARRVTLEHEGFLGCEVATVGPTGNNTFDCNNGLEQRNRWDFAVEADLAGAVLEVYWTPRSEAGKSMGIHLETLELGQMNVVLGDLIGESPLRITVPQSAAEKYYPQGGLMRLTVRAASDSTQNEAGTGASAIVQQEFQAFATLFYVDPPPGCYTIENPC